LAGIYCVGADFMRKSLRFFWVLALLGCFPLGVKADHKITIGAKRYAKVKLVLVVIGDAPALKECAQIMRNDFSFSGQFDVSVEYCQERPSTKSFHDWKKQGNLLAVFINMSDDEDSFEWRIYDTSKIAMLKGKRYKKRGSLLRGWAHNMVDMIWPELMGQESSFSTKIAYSKEIGAKGKRHYRHIYIADYDGSHPQPIITTPTINVAPRWNRDMNCPLLFYSESSQANISLHVTTMDGRQKVASNFDGLNMLPSFSKDGKKVVYCVSHGNGHCHLCAYEKDQLQQLTHNNGNNISPVLSDNGNQIFFCSDYKNGIPLIYCYDCVNGALKQITEAGPCFSPSLYEKNNKLAYIKRVDGVMQVFLYDLKAKHHTQFTTDTISHKEECCWSSCGNYLLFCLTRGNSSYLAIEHLITHERHVLTSSHEHCSYPTWSPPYNLFPYVMAKR